MVRLGTGPSQLPLAALGVRVLLGLDWGVGRYVQDYSFPSARNWVTQCQRSISQTHVPQKSF